MMLCLRAFLGTILLSVALCLCGYPLLAQTPTMVTGTIVDPNGLPYSFARISAQLVPATASPTILVNGIPVQIGGQQNASTDVNGAFSMNLFCNTAGGGCSVIQQTGTQWQFTVTIAPGIPPPAGFGPQSFSFTTTISGISQNLSSLIAPSALALARPGAGGSIAGAPAGYDARISGVTANGRVVFDAGTTNLSPDVTSATANCVSTDVGKKLFTVRQPAGNVDANGTVLSCNSATSFHTDTNATSTQTGETLFVGTDDTTALQAAYATAISRNTTLLIPSGMMLVSSTPFVAPTGTYPNNQTFSVSGEDFVSSVFVVSPNFNYAAQSGVIFSLGVITYVAGTIPSNFQWSIFEKFHVTALNQIIGAAMSNKAILTLSSLPLAEMRDVSIVGFDKATPTNASAFAVASQEVILYRINAQYDGTMTLLSISNAPHVSVYYPILAFGTGTMISALNSSNVSIFGGLITQSESVTNPLISLVNSKVKFYGLDADTAQNNSTIMTVDGTSTATLDGVEFKQVIGTLGTEKGVNILAGGKVYASKSILQSLTQPTATIITNAGSFFDVGGNAITGTTSNSGVTAVNPSSSWSSLAGLLPACSSTGLTQSACAPIAGSTNEKGTMRVTAGGVGGAFTMTLTFQGSSFIGPTGATPDCSFTYSNTGSASWTSPTILTISSKSATAITIAGSATTVNGQTYDMGYNCTGH